MEEGVLVGTDITLQWLLPWWWESYSKNNTHPVVFADLGMTENAKAWCKERGELLDAREFEITPKHLLTESTARNWERYFGDGIWGVRSAWMKKTLAMIQAPFEKTLWIDIDCKVDCNVQELFLLLKEADFVLNRHQSYSEDAPDFFSKYSSGVCVYKKNHLFFERWKNLLLSEEKNQPGDENILSKALALHGAGVAELPDEYNWDFLKPQPDNGAKITHFHGGPGKLELYYLLPHSYFTGIGIPLASRNEENA